MLPGAEHETPPVDACALLTDVEVAAATYVPSKPGERHDEGPVQPGHYAVQGTYSATCLWKLSSEGQSNDSDVSQTVASYVILNVMQWPKGSGQARRFLNSFRDAAKRGDISQTPVPLRIADEGLWWGDGVAAYKGDRSFGVSVHLVGQRDRERDIEEALARKVASRL
jgi:hypothetical protein